MASFPSNVSNGYSLNLETTIVSQDKANNYSVIGWKLELSNTTSTFQRNGQYLEVYINGAKVYSETKQITCLSKYSTQELKSGTTTVYHNSDGTKVLSVSYKWVVDNKTLAYMPSVDLSKSGTTILTPIPREASISLTLTNDEANFKYVTNNPAGFSLQVALKIGSQTILTTTAQSFDRLLTSQELDVIYTNSTTTNTPTIVAEVKSYNGATLIGTKTHSASLAIINNKPIFTNFVYSDTNATTVALTGNNQKIVLNGSSLAVNANGANSAVGVKKATIAGYRIVNGSNSVAGQSGTILKPTSNIVQMIAEDSRGNTTAVSKTMVAVAYTPVLLKDLSVERVTDGQTQAKIDASGSVWVGSFGASSNTLTFKYWFREVGTSTWVLGNTSVTATLATDWSLSKQINGDIGTLGFTANKSFEVWVQAYDAVGSDYEIRTLLVSINAFSVAKAGSGYLATVGCAVDGIAGLKVAGRVRDDANNVYIPYEIGDIKMTINNVNPSTKYGGTWVLWGAGRVPVGVDTAQTEFNTVQKTGGSKTHTLIEDEIPAHSHGFDMKDNAPPAYNHGMPSYTANSGTIISVSTKAVGGGSAHNNLQPYITCYFWLRTA